MPSITTLLSANDMSSKIKGVVSAKRLLELAESQLIPHYCVDDRIMFGYSETKEWLDHNFVVRNPGKAIGNGLVTIINVVSPSIGSFDVPIELRAIANLLIPMPLESIENVSMSGVYFLASQGRLVYVGQSINVMSRIGAHFGAKTFDFAFFVRVPPSDLDFVEGEFIRTLKPKYNFSSDGKRLIAPNYDCNKTTYSDSERLVECIKSA